MTDEELEPELQAMAITVLKLTKMGIYQITLTTDNDVQIQCNFSPYVSITAKPKVTAPDGQKEKQ